jgi:hypothetical protein
MSCLGESGCKGSPRLPDDLVCGHTRRVAAKAGVVAWGVPVLESGRIPQRFADPLGAIGRASGARSAISFRDRVRYRIQGSLRGQPFLQRNSSPRCHPRIPLRFGRSSCEGC